MSIPMVQICTKTSSHTQKKTCWNSFHGIPARMLKSYASVGTVTSITVDRNAFISYRVYVQPVEEGRFFRVSTAVVACSLSALAARTGPGRSFHGHGNS